MSEEIKFKVRLSTKLKDDTKYETFIHQSSKPWKVPDRKFLKKFSPNLFVSSYLTLTNLDLALREYPIAIGKNQEMKSPEELIIIFNPYPKYSEKPLMKIAPLEKRLWLSNFELENAIYVPRSISSNDKGVDLEYESMKVFIKYNSPNLDF